MAERKFILQFKMAPGDVLMLTALVRDIKLQYGDRYEVDVRTNFGPHFKKGLRDSEGGHWRHNPHITKLDEKDPGVTWVKMAYSVDTPGKHRRHFVTEFHEDFYRKTKIKVVPQFPHGDLHLSDKEKSEPPISGRYWVVVPGGKTDITTKWWSQTRYQEVVDRLRGYGLQFVQEGAVKRLCMHPPLERVLNVVGLTSIRDMIVNIYHAEGVICGITFPMHVAAALKRPCVVMAGGREEPWWESYDRVYNNAFGTSCSPVLVPHKYLHTFGQLRCCQHKGCWKQRVHKLNDRSRHDNSLCEKPVPAEAGQVVPECLDLINTDMVIEAVMSYYEDGFLPPPTWPIEVRNEWRKNNYPFLRGKTNVSQMSPGPAVW